MHPPLNRTLTRNDGRVHPLRRPLKVPLGDKARGKMSLAELEAAIERLERNRQRDHLHLLDGDHRFGWRARRTAGWRPRVGRTTGSERTRTLEEQRGITTLLESRLR